MTELAWPRVAVVGASSLVGDALLEELAARRIRCAELHALDEPRRLGEIDGAAAGERALAVSAVESFDFARADLVFFCGREALAARYADAVAARAWAIDGSAAHRERADVPLVVADVNAGVLEHVGTHGLVALPGSAAAALATVLAPLERRAGLERVEVATYHAVSGAGRGAVDELAAETVAMLSGKAARGRAFGQPIAFNVIPAVDALLADGSTREEARICAETRRVLERPDLPMNVTAVRVPVFFGHGFAVHVALRGSLAVDEAAALLRGSAGVALADPESRQEYPTPASTANAPDRVYVGRLRAGALRDRSLNFWIVADNVRKCAAHNAVLAGQILVNKRR